ncbi:T-complex protein 10 C-terminus-domain-containing protein [Polychytrium aggregatum]|uniref:T-complex protein 10 C-terminus-domain-containing protein n=1 Tax=Polychytrium aggregatum TaxID=110093 RepID=UPI0022FEABF9|nr:T-complex protein 10 C-terminus-domain-containing protein [Polychytrium aggregatum]KAI9207514.1 T-complex protein 10 C-terminus-domain-containing protein [Polychytrium aggregatum]
MVDNINPSASLWDTIDRYDVSFVSNSSAGSIADPDDRIFLPARQRSRQKWIKNRQRQAAELEEFLKLENLIQATAAPEQAALSREHSRSNVSLAHPEMDSISTDTSDDAASGANRSILGAMDQTDIHGDAPGHDPDILEPPALPARMDGEYENWKDADVSVVQPIQNSVLLSEVDIEDFSFRDEPPAESEHQLRNPIIPPTVLGPIRLTAPAPSKLIRSLFPALQTEPVVSTIQPSNGLASPSADSPEDSLPKEPPIAELLAQPHNQPEALSPAAESPISPLQIELCEGLERLSRERREFEDYRLRELQSIKEQQDESLRQIKSERTLWEKHRKSVEILPTKRERQEVEALKKQIAELNEMLKQRDQRAIQNEDRMKRRIDELRIRNEELQEEVKLLEQERAVFAQRPEANPISPVAPGSKSRPVVVRHSGMSTAASRAKGTGTGPSSTTVPSPARINTKLPPKNPPVKTPPAKTPPARSRPLSSDAKKTPIGSRLSKTEPPVRVTDKGNAALDKLQSQVGLNDVGFKTIDSTDRKDRIFANGISLTWYRTKGYTKEVRPDGTSIVRFEKGDHKTQTPDGVEVYYFASNQVTKTTFPNGIQFFEFPNGQSERYHPDGASEINYPDGTVRFVYSNGEQEIIAPDGTIQKIDTKGIKTIEQPDGTRYTL